MAYELESMNWKELEDTASDIISQGGHTREDVKTLSQVKYFMAIKSKEQGKQSAIREAKYNNERSTKSVSYGEDMAQGKAEAKAKSEAEELYGDYREMIEEKNGMNIVIKAIEGVIIGIQVELKEIDKVQV